MNNFYFTFSSYPSTADCMVYKGGYIVIKAENYIKAREKFKDKYGIDKRGFLPFAFQYNQDEWDKIIKELGGYKNPYCEWTIGKCWEIIE